MKKVTIALLGAWMVVGGAQAQSPTETLKPEAWNPVIEVVVQGDVPEILGIADSASLPMRPQPAELVDTGALSLLGNGEAWQSATLWSMVLVLALFIAFTWFNGPVRLTQGFSGNKVLRWSKGDVAMHWLGAIACLVLVVTGIVIAAGRHVFGGWMSEYSWNQLIATMVSWHNVFAFPFILGWLLMTVKWASKQMPEACDGEWFKSLGGYMNVGPLKGRHPDAGFANAGEKLWFWCFALFGGVLVVSGLVMMFPGLLGLEKGAMMWMFLLHCVSAIIIGAFSVVHIFMATIISEGGMECMVSGYCDENWARQHHNLWFEKQQ